MVGGVVMLWERLGGREGGCGKRRVGVRGKCEESEMLFRMLVWMRVYGRAFGLSRRG